MPKISIIVPIYNTEKYLSRCLNSILSQSFANFECILVDDCSTDNSLAICNEYTKKHNRISIIHKPINQGLPQARKTGIESTKGDFIQFIDSDDFVDSSMLDTMYQYTNNYDIIICDFYKETNEFGNKIYEKQQIPDISKEKLIKSALNSRYIHAGLCTKLVRRELLSLIDWPTSNHGEDRYITIQLLYYLKDVRRIKYINKPFYTWAYNQNSLTKRNDNENNIHKIKNNYNNHLKIINFLISKYGKQINQFDPDLSIFINWTKHVTMVNPNTRNSIIFKEMYPQSKRYFFDKSFNLPFYYKISLFLADKNIIFLYYILDFLRSIKSLLTKIKS